MLRQFLLTLLLVFSTSANEQEILGAPAESPSKRIAVIGAGAGGSSVAYNLRKLADASNVAVDITVFERASYVGGRSTTVNVFDDPKYPVELGASIFVNVNYNLMHAARDMGLIIKSAGHARPKNSADAVGIWDGEKIVHITPESMGWWDMGKFLWKYGLSPIKTQRLVKKTVGKFLRLYDEPLFPFESLTAVAAEVNLQQVTAMTGRQFLEQNNISPAFSREIIQASTRVNYGQNLPVIHGLEAMVCMATEGAVSIAGGNWQIFDGMLNTSQADVRLNHTVTSIDDNGDGTVRVSFAAAGQDEENSQFDEVVIAAPLQYTGISVSAPVERPPGEIPYVKLFVTLFASPHRLAPKFFGLQDSHAHTPEIILTTLPETMDSDAKHAGVGPTGFWSISTLRVVESPNPSSNPDEVQYVYKIFSPHQVTAEFISQILGLQHTEEATPIHTSNSSIGDLPKRHVSWYHEKIWNSYPVLHPRETFEDIKLGSHIWYTSGIESFISTMETSALMGKNVATLISRSWTAHEVEHTDDVRSRERREL